MPQRQEATNNGINPEILPQLRLRLPFSQKPLFLVTILTTFCVLLALIITLILQILLFVNFNAGTPFSEAEQKELVDIHNWFRGNVSPPAKNMQKMVWDNTAAKWAQKWANACKGGHGYQKTDIDIGWIGQNEELGIGWVGQNVHAIRGPRKDLGTTAVKGWRGEVVHYNYATNSCKKGKACGHYTQVVWAMSNRVGCGRGKEGCLNGGATFVVCNYYPPGNVITWWPYAI